MRSAYPRPDEDLPGVVDVDTNRLDAPVASATTPPTTDSDITTGKVDDGSALGEDGGDGLSSSFDGGGDAMTFLGGMGALGG